MRVTKADVSTAREKLGLLSFLHIHDSRSYTTFVPPCCGGFGFPQTLQKPEGSRGVDPRVEEKRPGWRRGFFEERLRAWRLLLSGVRTQVSGEGRGCSPRPNAEALKVDDKGENDDKGDEIDGVWKATPESLTTLHGVDKGGEDALNFQSTAGVVGGGWGRLSGIDRGVLILSRRDQAFLNSSDPLSRTPQLRSGGCPTSNSLRAVRTPSRSRGKWCQSELFASRMLPHIPSLSPRWQPALWIFLLDLVPRLGISYDFYFQIFPALSRSGSRPLRVFTG